MTEILFLGGIFNITDPVFHIQLYFWFYLLMVIVACIVYAGFRYGTWKQYAPLHGLYYAFKAGSNAAFIFGADLVGELVSERSAKCIFDYAKWQYDLSGVAKGLRSRNPITRVKSFIHNRFFYYPTAFLDIPWDKALLWKFGGVNQDVEIAKKLQNYKWEESPSVVVTGVPVDIVLDCDKWTFPNSPQHKAIEEAVSEWNDINPDDQVHSYSLFQKYMMQGKILCPPGVKRTFTVPWVRIQTAFPLNLEENIYGGDRRQTAEDIFTDETHAVNRFILPILIGGIGLAAMILIFRFAARFIH